MNKLKYGLLCLVLLGGCVTTKESRKRVDAAHKADWAQCDEELANQESFLVRSCNNWGMRTQVAWALKYCDAMKKNKIKLDAKEQTLCKQAYSIRDMMLKEEKAAKPLEK